MNIKLWLFPALLLLSVPVLAAQPLPVKVETLSQTHQFGTHFVTVEVTARDDTVRVESIRVNRGNCRIDNQKLTSSSNKGTILPITLRYGQTVRVNFYNNCVASEVEVSTDKGGWRFSYD